MIRRYGLRNDQWERIKGLLPGQKGQPGATARDNRLFVEAVLYRYRAGIAWRDLPERFGDFRVVHLRHSRWNKSGVWARVFSALAQDANNEYLLIDSTIVQAHQHSAGAKKVGSEASPDRVIGRTQAGQGDLGMKVHAMVGVLGNPTGFCLTPERSHDLDGAGVLFKNKPAQGVK